MNAERKRLLAELEDRLGYPFRNIHLLNQAVTHKSFINENPSGRLQDNERLEFFGDAVLGLLISDYFFHKLPDSNEGHLSKIRSRIVSEYSLAQIARELEVGKYLLLGKGEEMTGGRKKSSLMANAFEAIIAALYIDSGYERTYRTIIHLLKERVKEIDENELYRDYKSELQELMQCRKNVIPQYNLANESGPDHEKIFSMEVIIDGKISGEGAGRTKKEAEQNAAKLVLEKLDQEPGEAQKPVTHNP